MTTSTGIVIAGAVGLSVVRDKGTAERARVGRPTSTRSTFPDGLSAGSRNSSSCRTVLLAVAPFPPGALLPFIGTTRRSDFCRPFVGVSALFTSNYHSNFFGGGRQISPGKVRETLMRIRRLYALSPTNIGLRCWTPAHPGEHASSALHFRSIPHHTSGFHRTHPRGPSLLLHLRYAPASLVRGSLRQGPQRTGFSYRHLGGCLFSFPLSAPDNMRTRARRPSEDAPSFLVLSDVGT